MNEHPILFKGEMVRAILEGRKTQTRRVIIPQPVWTERKENNLSAAGWSWETKHCKLSSWPEIDLFSKELEQYCPYGKPGDFLWVRETWRTTGGGSWYGIAYKATENEGDAMAYLGCKRDGCLTVPQEYAQEWEHYTYGTRRSCNWRPSIHMPRWACRLQLRVKAVRVERVQDTSGDDAQKEGWPRDRELFPSINTKHKAIQWFEFTWDAINAKRGYGWRTNPWVWVIEFEREYPKCSNVKRK